MRDLPGHRREPHPPCFAARTATQRRSLALAASHAGRARPGSLKGLSEGNRQKKKTRSNVRALNEAQLRARALAQHYIDDLVEVLDELLAVPEQRCFPPDEMFDSTREVMAKARVIRNAVLDDLAPAGFGL